MKTFTLKNGTVIEIPTDKYYLFLFQRISDAKPNPYGYIEQKESVTVKFTNGVKITAPGGVTVSSVPVENADHETEIVIGNGGAVITQPDGTSARVSKDTVIDGVGNIIR